MSIQSLLQTWVGVAAITVFVSTAGAAPIDYGVVVDESTTATSMKVGASVDVSPDFDNKFPQSKDLAGSSTSRPTTSSHAVADVGLPNNFANGANGITFSELTFTILAPGILDGFGEITVPTDVSGANHMKILYTAKVASLTFTLGAPLTSPLVPTLNAGEWVWAGIGNVTISGVISPIVNAPSDASATDLGPFSYSQSLSMPLAGMFSGDFNHSRVTLGIPLGSLQNQSLSLPPIDVAMDLGGNGLVTGLFHLDNLVLTDMSTTTVYENLTATVDSDGDGVPDDTDLCPGTPPNTTVDANGCPPEDSDGDGVPDARDACSGTLAGPPVDQNGCSFFDDCCPCDGNWKNKGAYQSCNSNAANGYFCAGERNVCKVDGASCSASEAAAKDELTSEAAHSQCGRKAPPKPKAGGQSALQSLLSAGASFSWLSLLSGLGGK